MSEVSPMLEEFKWASPEDRRLAEMDAVIYGNCFVRRGEDGLMRRVDPTTVKAVTTDPPDQGPGIGDGFDYPVSK